MTGGPRPVAVVTGGAGGIASAVAEALAATHRLVVVDRSPEALDAVLERWSGRGVAATPVVCDVADAGSVRDAADVVRDHGELGVLLHAAGLAPPGAQDSRRLLEVNLLGTRNVLDAFVPLAGPGTTGVVVASLAGHRRMARAYDGPELIAGDVDWTLGRLRGDGRADEPLAAYSVSKRGVVLMAQHDARSWGRRGARLVSLSPGLILDTAIGAQAAGIHAGAYAEESAAGRAGTAADVAGVVVALASGGAAYVTGCDLLVDGGVLAAIDHHRDRDAADRWHAARP